jgi:hypothetical protein
MGTALRAVLATLQRLNVHQLLLTMVHLHIREVSLQGTTFVERQERAAIFGTLGDICCAPSPFLQH